MKKNNLIELISSLIVIFLVFLGFNYYYDYQTRSTNDTYEYQDTLNYNNTVSYYLDYYQNNYNVTINLTDEVTTLSNNYNITPAIYYDEILQALEELQDYFLVFNKEFFSNFNNYGFEGIEIYLADSIIPTSDNYSNADVVGLYIQKNNKYNIIISINSQESITTIAFHETFHAIEDYLSYFNVTFSTWNNLNPYNFTYSNIYYTNQIFSDTLYGSKYNYNAYFVDNYARSNEQEDRARMFEYLCLKEYFYEYPHLNKKINYLKDIILNNFPELYSYFI